MNRVSSIAALTLATFMGAAHAQLPQSAPGPTARALSYISVGSLKMAALSQKDLGLNVARCIAAISDDALAVQFEAVLAEQLSAEHRRYVDSFYATPVGSKYKLKEVQDVLVRNGGTPSEQLVELTSTDIAEYNAYASSPAGKRLTTVARLSGQGAMSAVKPALLGLIQSCRGDS